MAYASRSFYRLSGAVIQGYEQDVGTRTSFYGFTAFSLTQSLLILGGRGFRNVPVGKVSPRHMHRGLAEVRPGQTALIPQGLTAEAGDSSSSEKSRWGL